MKRWRGETAGNIFSGGGARGSHGGITGAKYVPRLHTFETRLRRATNESNKHAFSVHTSIGPEALS